MTPPSPPPATARMMRVLHGMLLGSLILIGGVFVVVARSRGGPMPAQDGTSALIAYASTGFSLAALIVAALTLRPRIAPRGSMSPDGYWSLPPNRTAALLLWVLTESAGWIGGLGYLLTGNPVPAAIGVLAVFSLMLQTPGRLTGD